MATTPLASVCVPSSTIAPKPEDLRSFFSTAFADPEQRKRLLGGLLCLGLLGLIFGVNLKHFVHAWSTDENYSHGFLVPLISLYFANQAAQRGPVKLRGGTFLGMSAPGPLDPRAVGHGPRPDSVPGRPGLPDRAGRHVCSAGGDRCPAAILVRDLLPDLHGPLADRPLCQDRVAAPVAGQPARHGRSERDRASPCSARGT